MGIPARELQYPYPDESERAAEGKGPSAQNKSERACRETIKIIAVGGGGGNALNHIISKGIEGVDLLAVNTDIRSLDMSLSRKKIILGEQITKGLGAGAMPEIGEKAARESLPEIREYLKGADMVYLTAGMGGGTGTGALPVIAAAAKEMGILTVAVVTKPFMFEGIRRLRYAEAGIEKLHGCVDALIVVPNDRLLEVSRKETPLSESFSMADEILRQAVQGVTTLVTRPGMVNVDFADLRTVMRQAGSAIMGVGCAKGENRVEKALKEALESPLMECSMQGAKGVLMNITCGNDLGIHEIQQAAANIEEIISDDATFVWGCVEDEELEGAIEIVIVATGFDNIQAPVKKEMTLTTVHAAPVSTQERVFPVWRDQERVQPASRPETDFTASQQEVSQAEQQAPVWLKESGCDTEEAPVSNSRSTVDYYDTPTFSRQNKTPRKPQVV